jgi:S-methylmethionine-dependent homocysteine/selenocysteine methylase
MITLINSNDFILMEGAIVEQLRRSPQIDLHPTLVNAPLIYDEQGRKELTKIFNCYIEIAKDADLPFLMVSPTWRTNQKRIKEAEINPNINLDAVDFLKELRCSHGSYSQKIKIGGMIGCKNDCYRPEEGLSVEQAESFHEWQINELSKAGVDFLIAETLPNTNEALGIARAMAKTKKPYVLSFVISRDGLILDGSSLFETINNIDASVSLAPLFYTVNCAYPSFLCAHNQDIKVFARLKGYMANASSLDHCDLENAEELQKDDITDWGDEMLTLNKKYGVQILGGCCGTGPEHLKYLVSQYQS